jgi:aspartate ammonia-lyase
VVKAGDLIAATGDTGAFADISGILKRIAVKLSKISNDLRLLSSGPRLAWRHQAACAPGRLVHHARQGQPVIPEVMNQVCFEVIGNDAAITMAVKPASCSSTPSSR